MVSQVFGQGEAGEERDDADLLSSSLQERRSELELESPLPWHHRYRCTNHSTWTLGDNPSLVPPDTNLKPQSTSLISKLAKLFRRRKSPQGIQEKRRASPKIVHAGQFNEPVVVTPWNADRRAQQAKAKQIRYRPVMSMNDRSRLSSRYRDGQSCTDTSLHRFSTMTSTADTRARDRQTSDVEPDDEHDGCCFVCCFRRELSYFSFVDLH
ncbi:hypothetical protein EDC04DRAFT_2801305 [Pisolithus marmoratus]|nr:hypothetical protein EDC04DRAFT_2801305 [Pisolithus marmoratus]